MQYCRERGLPGIALCVANTYGPGDYQPTPHGKLLWDAANGKVPIALGCAAPTVDIRDAAQAVLLAEQHGQIGERYIIANTYMNQIDLFGMAAAEYGGKPPKRLPLWLAYTMARLNELRARITGGTRFPAEAGHGAALGSVQGDGQHQRPSPPWAGSPGPSRRRCATRWPGMPGKSRGTGS